MASYFDVSDTLVHGGAISRVINLPSGLAPVAIGNRNMHNLLTPNTVTAVDAATVFHGYDELTIPEQTTLSFGVPMRCEGDVIGYAYEMSAQTYVTTASDRLLMTFTGLIGPNRDNALSGQTVQYRPIIPNAIGGNGSTTVYLSAKGVFAFNRIGTAYEESDIWIGYTLINMGSTPLTIDVAASIAVRQTETGPSIWSQSR